MSNVNGYIGSQQLKCVDSLIEKQRKISQLYDSWLDTRPDMKKISYLDSNPNYWVYGMNVPDKKKAITEFRYNGLYASGVHLNNNTYSVFGDQSELPGVNDFYKHFVAVPCGWWVEEKECLLALS